MDHKKFNQQFRIQNEIFCKAAGHAKKHSKRGSSKSGNRSSASYDKEIKVYSNIARISEKKSASHFTFKLITF